mgnify:FL=1
MIFYVYVCKYLDAKGDGITDKTIDDLFILKLIKAGDRLAFKHLFELYFTPLCRFVHLYMKKPGAAEDIVVDIFASFWERRETLQIQITLKAYLFQSARNRALNYLRDNERFISTDDFSSLERFENDETLETQELQRLIHEAIFSLPPKCRDVFNKSRMDNLSNKEIAEQMNISVKAVEGHISRALKQIRAYLGDAYHYLW